MQLEYFSLPVTSLKSKERPSVTVLQAQKDDSILCGLSFCRPILFRLMPNQDRLSIQGFNDMNLESLVGDDCEAVLNGLRPSTTGSTAFSVLHGSSFMGIKGSSLLKKSGDEIFKYLIDNEGKSSIVQILEGGKLHLRSSKESGSLVDVAHIGDYVFGLTSHNVWREPYLNPEKRETLRKDLNANFQLHRDDEGTSWLLKEDGTLLRMGQMDIKAKPTRLKLKGSSSKEVGFYRSASSEVDSWLYGVGRDPREFFRVRINPISREEEFQELFVSERPITSLTVHEGEKKSSVYFSVEGAADAELFKIEVPAAEDAEIIPPAPPVIKVGVFTGCAAIGTLTFDGHGKLWAGEGYLGWGHSGQVAPRIALCTHLL